MDIKELEIFQMVSSQQSFSKAAEQLNYVQSNVTARIHKLESELQTSLFHRNNRGVALTANGEILLEYTEKILKLLREAKEAVQNPNQPTGPLSIGATDITTAMRLPKVLSVYHKQYPDVSLSLTPGSTEELVNEVLKYNLDGAFVTNGVNHPRIIQETLIHEELVLIMDSSQRLKSIKDLKTRTILVFQSGCTYRAKLENWLREEGVLPVKQISFGTIEGMLGCVKSGLGVALVSKRIGKHLEREGSVICYPVPDKYKNVTTVFIRRDDVSVSNSLKKFLETTKKCFVNEEEYFFELK
ncbi:LysR family transcriptional regulator [Alkalihalobacterium bogoriense]|uniref:LysR family transcriptional regulator n=1 Tax=Alkalihalobacterium bogoriense TaxID=246272 RepID=UPI00047AE962|nr:LysR family transcriptional regulator [Alkalihalobacterium bogoriense]